MPEPLSEPPPIEVVPEPLPLDEEEWWVVEAWVVVGDGLVGAGVGADATGVVGWLYVVVGWGVAVLVVAV